METITIEPKGKIMTRTMLFILLLVMTLLLPACASKTKVQKGDAANPQGKWTKAVSKVIQDPERAEKLIALGVQYEDGTQALFSEIENINQEIMDINRNYDSMREDYKRALGKFTEKKNQAVKQYLEALFAMREQTTPEEWKALLR